MSDYKVINDNGYERSWEELYEDNVMFSKYTDKLEQRINKAKKYIETHYVCSNTIKQSFGIDNSECDEVLSILKGEKDAVN